MANLIKIMVNWGLRLKARHCEPRQSRGRSDRGRNARGSAEPTWARPIPKPPLLHRVMLAAIALVVAVCLFKPYFVYAGDPNIFTEDVGIGTTSPQSKLDVQGATTVGIDATGYDVKFYGTTSAKYLLWDASQDKLFVNDVDISAGGGAPTNADYLVGTANGSLSAEIVVGTAPGGELGGTWASPTIDDNITVTGWALGTITSGVGTALTALDGENIQNDTIDDDSLDFGSGADQIDYSDIPSGNISTAGTLTIGIDDSGYDVKFYGTTSGKYLLWDESADSLFIEGDTQLGNSVTGDTIGINAAANADNLITASFSETVADSTNYFIKGTLTDSGGVSGNAPPYYEYGYYLDQNISGTVNSSAVAATQFVYGSYIDLDSTSNVGTASSFGYQHLYGNYADVNFAGTLGGAGTAALLKAYGAWYDITGGTGGTNTTNNLIYGIYADANGNLGTTGTAEHYGGYFSTSNTADTNYGIYATASGATNNWGVYSNAGNNYFGDDIYIGNTTDTTATIKLGDTEGLIVGQNATGYDVKFYGTTSGKYLRWDASQDKLFVNDVDISAGGGAPTNADYLVGTANGSLSAEIVVGTTPGGELGGTWASPTIDDNITVTGWALGTITSGVGTALTALDGENIQNDTIDDDSLDFGSGADQIDYSDIPSGNISTAGTLTIGIDDSGYDVKFYGTTSGKYLLWDESADELNLTSANLTTTGTGTFGKVKTAVIYPSADGVAAMGVYKADGTTSVFNVDTTNSRLGMATAGAPQKTFTAGAGGGTGGFGIEMSPPPITNASVTLSGGSVPDGTYYYVMTASDNIGYTVASAEYGPVVVSGGGGAAKVTITFTQATSLGGSYFCLYRTTTSGVYNTPALVDAKAVTSGSANTMIDTAAAPSTGAPPTVTTAYSALINSGGASIFAGGQLSISNNNGRVGILQLGQDTTQNAKFSFTDASSNNLQIQTTYTGNGNYISILPGTVETMRLTRFSSTQGRVSLNGVTPSAILTLPAGTATAGTAPLKFTSGTLLTATEAGAIEYLNNTFHLRSDGLTVGVDDTGYDVKFYGTTSAKYLYWNQASDKLIVAGDLQITGTQTGGNNGTVTSVGLSAPTAVFDVTGSPVTTSGTLTLGFDNQNANVVFTGPASGAAAGPSFRALVDDDIPSDITIATTKATTFSNTLTVGQNAVGYDVKFYGTTSGKYLRWDASQDKLFVNDVDISAGGGAPTNADYLVGTANGSLSAEIVVGTAPGGSLGGTWASPTIDDLFIKLVGDTTGVMTEDLNLDDGTLVISYDDNKVGIGTTSPDSLLEISGGNIKFGDVLDGATRYIGKSAAAGGDIIGGDANWIAFISGSGGGSTDQIAFGTHHSGVSGGERVRINGDGNVGIGTTNPATKLDVQGAVTVGANTTGYDVKFYGTTSAKYLRWDQANDTLIAVGGIVFGKVDNGNSGAAKTIDWGTSNKQEVTLTAAPCTLTFTAPHGAGNLLLKLAQDATGSRTVTWPTVKWPSGTAPTLTTTANAIDIVSFYYDGSNYFGQASLNFAAAP